MATSSGQDKVRISATGYFGDEAALERRRKLNASRSRTAKRYNNITDTAQKAKVKEAMDKADATYSEYNKQNELSGYYVEFDATPDLNESAAANYSELSDIRAPASILIYTGSPSRTFQITGKLISRSAMEATINQQNINILRSWRMPESLEGGVALSIPTILRLEGYGNLFKNIPVVMTNLSIDLTSEFDGVRAWDETPIPIITPVSITLRECRNVDGEITGLNSFDIELFRAGLLPEW